MKKLKVLSASVVLGLSLTTLTACGSDSSDNNADANNGNSTSSGDTSGEQTTLTVWGWGAPTEKQIAGFEAANPNIKIDYNNTGTASDTALALSNAVQAGSGAPDVTMLEAVNVPQFALSGALEDLSTFGADKLKDQYVAGAWNKIEYDGKPYAMPNGGATMVFFYNKAVFDQAGIAEAPKTWDEYYEDAKKVAALGGGHFMTNDTGDKDSYSEFNAMLWQAEAQPYKVDGTNITISLDGSDANAQKFFDLKQKMIDEKLLDTKTKQWSDDWFRGLNDGTIASLVIGAWMPINLESNAPDAAGDWRVAQLPQWTEGGTASAEDGGDSFSIVKSSEKKDAAWKFVEYMTHGEGAQIGVDNGVFPTNLNILQSPEFTAPENEYFGGQKVNEVLAAAAALPASQFSFLPYNAYAQPTYGDIMGKAFTGEKSYADALKEYQDNLVEYGNLQGFSVNK